MDYIAPRNMTVSSTSGRSVTFEKGVPKYAPHQMHAELIAVGVVPTEDSPEPAVSDGPREPVLPTDRTAAINAAFEKIALRNERTDFTSNGSPHAAVIAKELGWSIGGKERDLTWQKFSLERSGL